MKCPNDMRPNADRLRELRGSRDIKDVEAESGVGWRTIAAYEAGAGTTRFQFNQLHRLAVFYGVDLYALIESAEAPAHKLAGQPAHHAPA